MKNDFELPNLKNNEEENNENQPVNEGVKQDKIEIPQEYYDKLNKEKEQRLQELAIKEQAREENKQNGGVAFMIIINGLILFVLLYAMLNINKIFFLVIPAYIILGSIISYSNKKENSKFGVSILVGGMIGALISFLLGMSNKSNSNTYIYYAFVLFFVTFFGQLLSFLITMLMNDKSTGIRKMLSLIVIIGIIAGPFYGAYQHKEMFDKYIFASGGQVEASTEEEYIEKTLKNRYGNEFVCDGEKKHYLDDVTHRKLTTIGCHTNDNEMELEVRSIVYNEDKKQYIVRDNYIDEKYIKPLKAELVNAMKEAIVSKSVSIGIYPENKCFFIGDCENNKDYQKEMNLDNLFKYSDELRLKNYLSMSSVDFFNNYQFDYNIVIKGNYSNVENFEEMINKITDLLDQKGLRNTRGYTIIIRDSSIVKDVYKVTGDLKSIDFKNYKVVND